MVTEKKVGDRTVFLCDICGLGYSERSIAQDCEDYCKAHPGSCSVDIPESCLFSREPVSAKEKIANLERCTDSALTCAVTVATVFHNPNAISSLLYCPDARTCTQ